MAEMIRGLNWRDFFGGLNLVLLGKIGAGKSASGNTILGRQAFESKESFTSVTLDLAVESGTVCGRRVTVYDTPGLFNTKLSEEEIQQIYAKVLQRCESGPCVFLLVIKADRFTGKERQTVEKIEELLGEERLKRTWILFTGRDELEEENMSIDEFINDTEPLRRLVQKYDQRYHVFNNKKKEPNGQVQELLRKIYATHPDIAEKGAKPKLTVVTRPKRIAESMMSMMPVPPECSERITASVRSWVEVDTPFFDTTINTGKPGVGKRASGNTMEEEGRQKEEKQRQEEIERVRKETEERVRAEFEGPPKFLQERLKQMRLREKERIQRQEELERDLNRLRLQRRLMARQMENCMEMQRKQEEEQKKEEIERVIKETVEKIRAEFEGSPRFLRERFKSMRLREEEREIKELEERFRAELSPPRLFERFRHLLMREEREGQRQEEIERVRKETEEKIRAEFEGTPSFLLERLKQMRRREEERIQQEEGEQEEFKRVFFTQHSPRRHMAMRLKRKQREEKQRQEEIERVIKETGERIRAEFEGPPR